jgi:hypothetical protein
MDGFFLVIFSITSPPTPLLKERGEIQSTNFYPEGPMFAK